MADSSYPFVAPQFQGNAYLIQRQQALANALAQNAMQGQPQPQMVGSGGSQNYQVMPHTSPLAPVAQVAQGFLAHALAQRAAQDQNQLGKQQMDWATGDNAPQQLGLGALSNALGSSGAQPPLQQPPAGQPGATAGTAGGYDAVSGDAGLSDQLSQQPRQQGALAPGGPLNPLGIPVQQAAMLFFGNQGKYWDIQSQAYKPAEIVSQIRAAGIDPNSTLGRQIAQQSLAKSNYIAPISARPGGALMMPDGSTRYTLPAPQAGGMWATNPDGSLKLNQAGQPYQVAIGGAAEIEGGMAGAKTQGEGAYLPYSGFDQQGNPLPVTNRTTAATQGNNVPLPLRNNNPGAVSHNNQVDQYPDMQTGLAAMDKNLASYVGKTDGTLGGIVTRWVGSAPNAPAYIKDVSTRLGISPNTPIDLNNPAQRQALSTAIMLHENGPSSVFAPSQKGSASQSSQASVASSQPTSGAIYAQPQPGFNQGQQDLQTDLTKKWGTLNEANSQAQNTISYLSNIRGLASKAALGQQSDKINFVNGLLSLAGSEKATDAVTANNLLDKYSNQIVARLGTGGLGTDAARSLLHSAYPNAHMTQGAIGEAVDNLVGASQMTQAKARLLQGDYNARNPQAYNQKEMIFDQNADPRIWQFQNMNPQQRQAFKASMTPDEQQQFGKQIRELAKLGVLK